MLHTGAAVSEPIVFSKEERGREKYFSSIFSVGIVKIRVLNNKIHASGGPITIYYLNVRKQPQFNYELTQSRQARWPKRLITWKLEEQGGVCCHKY